MLDINLDKDMLLAKLKFEDALMRETASHYFDLKGIMYYINMINYLEKRGVVDSTKEKVEYKVIGDFYHYDKRLRKIIYKYVGALEEYIRAYILNNKIDFIGTIKEHQSKRYEDITKKDERFLEKNPAEQLLEFSFRDIANIVIYNLKIFKKVFKNRKNELGRNMNAVVDLRNKVNHFKILLMCDDYKMCCDNLINNSDLERNIINLINLLPECFRENMLEEIDEAKRGLLSSNELKDIFINI